MAKEDLQLSGRMVWYSVLILLIVGGISTVLYLMKPVWLGFERKAFKASHQYIESKRDHLSKLTSNISELDVEIAKEEAKLTGDPEMDLHRDLVIEMLRRHKEALVLELKRVVDDLPLDEVPSSAKKYLFK